MLKSQRDAIVKKIDAEYGNVPSDISNALSKAEEIVGRAIPEGKDRNEALYFIRAAVAANRLIGTDPGKEQSAPGMLVWIRQQLLNASVTDDAPVETPPVGGGFSGEHPAEFVYSMLTPWVNTEPNTAVCIKLPNRTRGLPGDGVSMALGGAAKSPLYVTTGPSPIRDIAEIKRRVQAGNGIAGNGSTSRTPYTPGHYMSCFFEEAGQVGRQLLHGDAN